MACRYERAATSQRRTRTRASTGFSFRGASIVHLTTVFEANDVAQDIEIAESFLIEVELLLKPNNTSG